MRTLRSMTDGEIRGAVNHPAQRRLLPVLSDLIRRLRACRSNKDYFDLQTDLLEHRRQHEVWRAECARAEKRVKRLKQPRADAPGMELVGGDPTDSASWRAQTDVYTRLTHQLRSVGDALAWTVLGFRRDLVVALSRSLPPGPMDPSKSGTDHEVAFVNEQWQRHGRFALMHDLTNCLRIADVTVFCDDAQMLELYELKTAPRRKDPVQVRRIRVAGNAVSRGGALPGDDRTLHLLPVPVPYATQLGHLDRAIGLAYERGMQTVAVPGGGRAIEVYHLPAIAHDTEQAFMTATHSRKREAARRAGVRGDAYVRGVSVDLAGHDPLVPPWGIYPLSPEACALLIANQTVLATTLSMSVVQEVLQGLGVQARFASDDRGTLLHVSKGGRASGMSAINFYPLLFELADLDTWARGTAYVMEHAANGTPGPYSRTNTSSGTDRPEQMVARRRGAAVCCVPQRVWSRGGRSAPPTC